jgi:hypothetical protein
LHEERLHCEGVAPGLVAALAGETQVQAAPLPLEQIVPRRHAWAAAALMALLMAALLAPALVDPEWQTALARLMLIDRPYTTIAVAPGDAMVEQGHNLSITVDLKGRRRSPVVLQTRPAGRASAPWSSRPLALATSAPATRRTATVERIREPLDYRVVAGPAASPTWRIHVRYPLALTTFEVTLTPPAYTGLSAETVKGGDLRAVAGTEAAFRMVFDEPPREAALVVSEPKASLKDRETATPPSPPPPRVIPLVPDGKALGARLSITRDMEYAIVARAPSGRKLPENRYRIDARADYPPRVGFDEPEEALEVHPIAEVLNRIRVADDFGLSRAGIVYRVNDGEERTLIERDFTAQSAKPLTAARLEETLALEMMELKPTDSVTYYAFAEDNFPGGLRRTETDLRYIDIRPFKRRYQRADDGGGEPGESTTLEELIARQRFNLNRTVRLAKHKPGDRAAAEDPLKIASFEELLAALTREVLDGLQAAADGRFESLQQAEAAMVAAVNALDREKHADASALEAEALRHLIEARRTFLFLVANRDSGEMIRQRLRAFDRTQAQKLRKPKDETEEAEVLVAEIEELAGDEDFVYATIAQLGEDPGALLRETEGGEQPGPSERAGEMPKESNPKPAAKKADRGAPGKDEKPGTGDGQKGSDRAEASSKVPERRSGSGTGPDRGGAPEGGRSKSMDRRAVAAEQGRIADAARDLEERLKRLEPASALSRLRMAKAAEAAERASGALARGQSREAAALARSGASLLHEMARQVKGEIAREPADVVAMARDLAEELARREAEFAEARDPESSRNSAGTGGGARGKETDADADAEMLQRLAEAARTLQAWLEQLASRWRGEGTRAGTRAPRAGQARRDHSADRSDRREASRQPARRGAPGGGRGRQGPRSHRPRARYAAP